MKISQDEILDAVEEVEYIEQLTQAISDDFHITSHERKAEYSDEKKIIERFKFEIENLIQADHIYLNPFLVKFFDKNPFVSAERNYPVDFGHPLRYQYIINIKIPEGYKLKSLPEDKNYNLPDNGGNLKLNINSTIGMLNVFFTFDLNFAHFSNDIYSEIKSIFSEVIKIQDQSLIVLVKV